MKLLAVETATEACSAALYLDGDIAEKYQLAPREHTKLILPMLDALMAEASLSIQQLDALAFGCGPGSFTGLRIATGVIHGVAFAADLPVVPVSTLAALAQAYFHSTDDDYALPAMDARMGEIYWAVYSKDADGNARLHGKEWLGKAEDIAIPDVKGYGVGSGWQSYEKELTTRLHNLVTGYDATYLPRASYIAGLGVVGFANGAAVPVEQAMPVYLRDKVAKKTVER